MKRLINHSLLFLMCSFLIYSCKKDDAATNNGTTTPTKEYAVVIENGAQSVEPGAKPNYNARLVNKSGEIVDPASVGATVTWSTSNDSIAKFSAGSSILSVVGQGSISIKVTIVVNSQTYIAEVPLGIQMPSLFAVAPSAIIMMSGETVQLETFWLTMSGQVPSYTYTSSKSAVCTVSSTGKVTGVTTGESVITVKGTLEGNPSSFMIPVLVVGLPEVVLPITQVKITPNPYDMFRNDVKQFSAKAFKSDGSEVTGETFTWKILNDTVASVDASGNVTAKAIGSTYLQATAKGIIGQAEIEVSPDTAVLVTPFYKELGAGMSHQFTAKTYNLRTTPYTEISASITWMFPNYGPGFEMFDIGSVDNTGKVTLKSGAMAGMSNFLIAMAENSETSAGGALVMVSMFAVDCGNGNAEVKTLTVNNGTDISLAMSTGQTHTIDVTAKDANGMVVSSPALKFNSSASSTVAMVDADSGVITPVGMGTADITICSGSFAETKIKVTVSF